MKKILLDENLPKRLQYRLIEHGFDTKTVRDMDWLGLKNGKLLKATLDSGFDIFVTSDKKMQFEQNIKNISLAIIILDIKNLNYFQSIQPKLQELVELIPIVTPNKYFFV